MENLNKGDIIFNLKTKKEYIVDIIEEVSGSVVVYTDEENCKCFPIEDLIKLGQNKLANYFLKKIYGIELTEDEDKYIVDKIKELKPITISPFDENFFKSID